MASLCVNHALRLIAILALASAAPALAQDPPAEAPAGLYERPVLVVDPGMHTATIKRADVDADGRYAVTGSDDKTVRVWSVEDGRLLRTIRVPAGPGDPGKIYATALSRDGKLIAAAGWTRNIDSETREQIYLFDPDTGDMVGRIEGLPGIVNHLTFSPDGRYLAASLGWGGLRVYGRDAGWAEFRRDTEYGEQSYGADFSADGRLATTSVDGRVRLYDRDFQLLAAIETTGGRLPYGVAFSPDGARLAIGYVDSTVDLIDARTLARLPGPDIIGIDNGNLANVAWSADGETLFAAGWYLRYDESALKSWRHPVVAWSGAGLGARREMPASTDTIMSLVPLVDGSLLVAASDPYLALLDPDGRERWVHGSPNADFRGHHDVLAVSTDGRMVDFHYELRDQTPARFNVATLALSLDPSDDSRTAPPKHDGLAIDGLLNTYQPTLNGKPLPLEPYERSRSLAIHPDGKRFALGTDWSLRAYNADGEELWRKSTPSVVWGVNITGDGRLVVAAYGDGTIRWHRMDDGKELLAFLPLADRPRWVAWTPDGYYASSSDTGSVLGWHVNRGWDQQAEFYPITAIKGFFQPDVLPLVLQELETPRALGLAKLARDRERVQEVVQSPAPPGAQLHVLTIGVSEYANHEHLTLDFADDDARDIANTLLAQEGGLYAKVNIQHLSDDEVTRGGFFAALKKLHDSMQPEQDDVAVIHFSGHGAEVDGTYYLLPNDVEADDDIAIIATGVQIRQVEGMLRRLGERGKVLVLLDACHSGNVRSGAREALPPDIEVVRNELAAAGNGVIVLTSSSGQEISREDPDWQNGAFTEAVLEALQGKGDGDGDDWLSVGELEEYVTRRVRELTENRQNPRISVLSEHHFQARLFVAGL